MNQEKFDSGHECAVPTFGCPMANNGWVQCRSKTFPGKFYYFNVDSRCRTWGRPVSSRVTVPIVNPTKPNIETDVFSDDEFEVSDIEDDDSPLISDKRRKMFGDILFKLYHCDGDDEIADVMSVADASFACKTEFIKEEDETKENFSPVFPEICYSSSSDGESFDGKFRTNRRRFGASDAMRTRVSKRLRSSRIVKNCYSRSRARENRSKESRVAYDRFGQLDSFGSTDLIDRPFHDHKPLTHLFLSSYDDDTSAYYEENEDEEEDDESEENFKMEIQKDVKNNVKKEQTEFSLPRLKVIQLSDLIIESPRVEKPLEKKAPKRPVRKVDTTAEESLEPPRNKIKKIINELNGIKTISYDFVDPELPPGVKASNLSDSESSTFPMAYFNRDRDETMKNDVKKIEIQSPRNVKFPDDFINIKNPRLSDSSSSDSSSSSSEDTTTNSSSDSDSSSSTSTDTISTSLSESGSSDCSCSTCSSSSSSSTSSQSLSDIRKKEKLDSDEISSSNRGENNFGKISTIPSNFDKTIKIEAEASPSSSSNDDITWKPSDNGSDGDD